MKSRFTILYAVNLVLLAVMFAGCSNNQPVGPSIQSTDGTISFAFEMMGSPEQNIASGMVTIHKGALSQAQNVVIDNYSGTVTFANIQVGEWSIAVQLFDSAGVKIYSGDGSVVVNQDQTTTVTINVNQNTGSLIIKVDLDEFNHTAEIGRYLFDGNLSDELTMGAGTLFGTTVSYQPGKLSQALDLNNIGTGDFYVNDYVQLPNTSITHDFTVSLWIKFRFNSNSTYACFPFAFGRAYIEDSFDIQIKPGGDANAVILSKFGGDTLNWYVTPGKNIKDDQWHHIVVTFKNKTLAFYVDNSLIGITTLKEEHTPDFSNLHQFVGLGEWQIGDYKRSNFNGMIDQLRIFNEALTPEDISKIYNQERGN